jgi:arginyl-tRNA--protein-N-Asp/Glu arginylyltransferase
VALRVPSPFLILDDTCPYFPDGRPSRTAFVYPDRALEPPEFEAAIHLGMRRSGHLLYRPICPGCRKCQPYRVEIAGFRLSDSQKRVWKRCEGKFEVSMAPPSASAENIDLYRRYGEFQHGKGDANPANYSEFLVDSIADTYELSFRREGRLAAVSIVDVLPTGVSSVYSYWEPELREWSVGTYTALFEIDLCRRNGLPYYYLGFLVPGAKTMNYKAKFGPGEVWDGENWLRVEGRDPAGPGMREVLEKAEQLATLADTRHFPQKAGNRIQ